uniref:hypothetical protein n=1 Tax=Candidatus Electrothrix sp. TaxID=2170559 RepID=UPI0040564B36
MNYNPTAQTTHCFVDIENKMMLVQNHSWNPNGKNGKGDGIGRAKDAYFCYGDPQFIEGVKNCWKKIECDPDYEDCSKWKYYWKGHRYPTPEYFAKDFSRDHTSNTFVLMKLAGEDEWIKDVAENIKYTIRKKHVTSSGKVRTHRFTPALWGFVKSFAGKWWGKPLFYGVSFFEIIGYNIQNGFVYLIGWFSRELHPEDYNAKRMAIQKQGKWKQFWRKKAYPIYALNLFGWQLFVMNDNFIKRLLQYMSYLLIPRYNHFLMLLFNVGKVTKEQVLEYKSMKGGRWTTPLNELNDRDVFIINKEEWLKENTLDRDLLISMWNYRNPKDKII